MMRKVGFLAILALALAIGPTFAQDARQETRPDPTIAAGEVSPDSPTDSEVRARIESIFEEIESLADVQIEVAAGVVPEQRTTGGLEPPV